MVEAYSPGTARGGAKIRFASRVDTLFKLLELIEPLAVKQPERTKAVSVELDFTEMVRQLRGEPRVIDVTPQ